jgi:O-antigen ligase
VFAAVLLLVIDIIPWRAGKYFSGQLDWVVLGKTGLLIAVALVILWVKGNVALSGRSINIVMAPALLLVALYMGWSDVGALLSGSLLSSVQLSVRTLVVGFLVLVLIEVEKPMIVMSTLSRVLAAVAIFIAVTGSPDDTGRLAGNFPPISANELAFLAAVPMVYFVWRTVNVDTSFVRILVVIALGVIIFLTQSRTTTAVAAAVVLFLIIRGTRNGRLHLSITAGVVICLLFTLTFTNAIQKFGSRGGTSSIESAGSRTIAWNAVLNSPQNLMQSLFGHGLGTKMVPVAGQFWREQIFDSSWVSAYVQAGLIGLVLAVALVIYAATQALRNARPANDLWLALLVLVVVRSIFESGLLDTSTSFFVFMVVSLGAATQARLGRFSGGNDFHARV